MLANRLSPRMTTGPPSITTRAAYAPEEQRRFSPLSSRFEEPLARQYADLSVCRARHRLITHDRERLQRMGARDLWAAPFQQAPPVTRYDRNCRWTVYIAEPVYSGFSSVHMRSDKYPSHHASTSPMATAQWSQDPWQLRQRRETYDRSWPTSPLVGPYPAESMPSPALDEAAARAGHAGWHSSWPGGLVPTPLLRRTSSSETKLGQYAGLYYTGEGSASASNLHARTYLQRRPSNRDEFDGPSQLLDRPADAAGNEPKEEDLPELPVTLHAQEQDEILSKVNDRLSQCAYDFVARYQFPIPIEPDKRPVRVPGDREWSEWVYLLKRLATKRRIPARVLYNGQIKQLITILENSLEMRHAAKHQSRPLKDDRNILQLISSGLQVSKILKDAPAMQYLDSLYVQTEMLIQSRRMANTTSSFA